MICFDLALWHINQYRLFNAKSSIWHIMAYMAYQPL